MATFSFDVEMYTSITVEADSAEAAEEMISEKLEQAQANLGAWDNGDPILCDIGLPEDAFTLTSTEEDESD